MTAANDKKIEKSLAKIDFKIGDRVCGTRDGEIGIVVGYNGLSLLIKRLKPGCYSYKHDDEIHSRYHHFNKNYNNTNIYIAAASSYCVSKVDDSSFIKAKETLSDLGLCIGHSITINKGSKTGFVVGYQNGKVIVSLDNKQQDHTNKEIDLRNTYPEYDYACDSFALINPLDISEVVNSTMTQEEKKSFCSVHAQKMSEGLSSSAAFKAMADDFSQKMILKEKQDKLIEIALGALGLKVGDKCYWNDPANPPLKGKEVIIVGYNCRDHFPIVEFVDRTIGPQVSSTNLNVHSSINAPYAFEIHRANFKTKDQQIEDDLSALGLKIGDKVYYWSNSTLPKIQGMIGEEMVVVGCDGEEPIIEFSYRDNANWIHPYDGKFIHSTKKTNRPLKFSRTVIQTAEERKAKTEEAEKIKEKDAQIEAVLSKLGFKIGDKVYYDSVVDSKFNGMEMIIVGASADNPVAEFVDAVQGLSFNKLYSARNRIHSTKKVSYPFTIDKSAVKTQDKFVDARDKYIESKLVKHNLKIGDKVYYDIPNSQFYNQELVVIGYKLNNIVVAFVDKSFDEYARPLHSAFVHSSIKHFSHGFTIQSAFVRTQKDKESRLLMDKAIEEGLAKLRLKIGEKVNYNGYYKEFKGKELVIVGLEGSNVIVEYADKTLENNPARASVDTKYIHSSVKSSGAFRCSPIWFQTKNDIEAKDKTIEEGLKKLGLEVGDKVYYNYGLAHTKFNIVESTVVGYSDGHPVIDFVDHNLAREFMVFKDNKNPVHSTVKSTSGNHFSASRHSIMTQEEKRKKEEDKEIENSLSFVGLKVGEKVYFKIDSNRNGQNGREMIVVGYDEIYPIVQFIDFTVDYSDTFITQKIHSSMKEDKNKGAFRLSRSYIRTQEEHNQDIKDKEIESNLAAIGLKIGDKRRWNCGHQSSLSEQEMIVVGFDNGNPIMANVDSEFGHIEKRKIASRIYEADTNCVHSRFKNDLSPIPTFRATPSSIITKEEALRRKTNIQKLESKGLKLGDIVYWKNDSYEREKLIVVGHNNQHPIVAFVSTWNNDKKPGISYQKDNIDDVDVYYQCYNNVFELDRSVLETKKEMKDRQTIINATSIKDRLAKLGFSLGEKVKLSLGGNEGYVAGIADNDDIVIANNTLSSSSGYGHTEAEAIKKNHLHTDFVGKNYTRFLYSNKNYVEKVLAEKQVNVPAAKTAVETAPKSRDVNDKTIEENLAKLSLSVGDEVNYCIDNIKGKNIKGYIAGYIAGIKPENGNDVIIAFKAQSNYPSGASEHYITKDLHSSFLDKGYRFFHCLPRRITKNTPTMKSELKKAGYRIAAAQTLKLTHGAICEALKSKGATNESINAVSTLLSTEYGRAALSLVMGIGLEQGKQYLPSSLVDPNELVNNPGVITQLAKELRIGGMTIAGNELFETIFKSALEVLLNQENNTPVAEEKSNSSEEDSDLEEHLLEELSSKQLAVN